MEFLGVKVGTEVGPCDGMSDRIDLLNIAVGSWTRTMDGSPLGELLD